MNEEDKLVIDLRGASKWLHRAHVEDALPAGMEGGLYDRAADLIESLRDRIRVLEALQGRIPLPAESVPVLTKREGEEET